MSTRPRSDLRCRALAQALAALLALAPAPAHADAPAPAPTPDPAPDPLSSLRERFRAGMDKYESRAFAEAIVIWESIYRELGSDKGYRLAFNLARAYDELGDLSKAAEHYETYLDRVAGRRSVGETLEPNVEQQEVDARERRDTIAAAKGRIRVRALPTRAVVVQVDNTSARVAGFTVYVEPGPHTVTLGTGPGADVRRVTLKAGEVVDIDPREEAPPPPPPPPTRWETRIDHPYSSTLVWVGAGVALASLVVPIITYTNALSIKSDYEDPSIPTNQKNALAEDYESARSNAYASIVVPALFTAAAGTLALFYVLGTKETRIAVPVTPTSASVGLTTRF